VKTAATEQLAEVPSSLLNRSLDTASAARAAGRRTRSAAAAAARRAARLRPPASTSSVPAPDNTERQTTAAVQDKDTPGWFTSFAVTNASAYRPLSAYKTWEITLVGGVAYRRSE